MTWATMTGSYDPAPPWLHHVAAAMLDCALRPVLDASHAQTLLESVEGLGHGSLLAPPGPGSDFVLRSILLATAEALLDRPNPRADGNRWRVSNRALALAEVWLGLPGLDRSDASRDRLRYGLGLMASQPPDLLAADMRRYRDEPLELLADAHPLVRLAAAAWHLSIHGYEALGEVARLLEQQEAELASRLSQARFWEPPHSDDRAEAELRQTIERFRSLEATLLPMADAENLAAALTALESLLPRWLGQSVLPFRVTGDGLLTVQGSSDLAGQSIRLQGGRSLAATALLRGGLVWSHAGGAEGRGADGFTNEAPPLASVFDRQCADRLGVAELVAVPVGLPEPVAVLLLGAGRQASDLNLVSIHAGRWLVRIAGFENRVKHAASQQQERFSRRMHEAVHEISNPLAVIQNYVHLLANRLDGHDPAQEQMRLIRDELRRAASLVRGLTEEEAPDTRAAGSADLNGLVSKVLTLVQASLGADAAIEVRFTPGHELPPVDVLEQHLHQVLLNLARNALEAMPDGGILDVVVDQSVNDRGQRGVEIQVSDTGGGIDPELLAHIFESGVSAKGEGRGLGLAITSRLVHELGGRISCRSRPGAGTTFVVWLPAA